MADVCWCRNPFFFFVRLIKVIWSNVCLRRRHLLCSLRGSLSRWCLINLVKIIMAPGLKGWCSSFFLFSDTIKVTNRTRYFITHTFSVAIWSYLNQEIWFSSCKMSSALKCPRGELPGKTDHAPCCHWTNHNHCGNYIFLKFSPFVPNTWGFQYMIYNVSLPLISAYN